MTKEDEIECSGTTMWKERVDTVSSVGKATVNKSANCGES